MSEAVWERNAKGILWRKYKFVWFGHVHLYPTSGVYIRMRKIHCEFSDFKM
jgi:hypothetical protein